MTPVAASAAPGRLRISLRWVLMLVLLGAALVHAGGFLADAIFAVQTPVGLDYGEGIVWQQMALIPGPRMYETAGGLPFIVFHYPPVYHLVVRAMQGVLGDPLAAGRLVSVVSTLALLPLLAGLMLMAMPRAKRWTPSTLVAVAVVALLLLSMRPVQEWGVVMRVDMLGLALGCAGLLVASWAGGRFWGTLLALLLCLLAVFTKQSLLSFGIAVFLLSVLRRPVATLAAAAIVAAVGIGAVLVLQGMTGGGFLQNILGNNINRFSLLVPYQVIFGQGPTLLVLEVMAVTAFMLLRQVIPKGRGAWRHVRALGTGDIVVWRRGLAVAEVGLSCVALLTLFKVGGYVNYLLELCCAGCVVAGIVFSELMAEEAGSRGLALMLAVLIAGVALRPERAYAIAATPERAAVDAAMLQRIREATLPVSSEDMVLLMQAGKGVVYEPAIATELALVGRWDEAPLVRMIRNHGFAFFLTAYGDVSTDRQSPEVARAVREAYPRLTMLRTGLYLWERP